MNETLLIPCPQCGTMNRVPQDKLAPGVRPVCGKCRSPLPVDHVPVAVTDATFTQQVERSNVPVLLDAWAAWCGPCRALEPTIEQLAAEMSGRVRVVKLNVDENPETAMRFDLRSIPTLLVFKDGREIDRIVGLRPKAEISQRLERVLA